MGERVLDLGLQVIAEADEVRLVRDGRGELALALGERNRSQVAPVGERQVEHVVHDRGIGPGVERVLQRLEARAAVLAVHGDLAVEPGAPEPSFASAAREVRELPVQSLPLRVKSRTSRPSMRASTR